MSKHFTLLISTFFISSIIQTAPPSPTITAPASGTTVYIARPDISGTETQLNTVLNMLASGNFVATMNNSASNWTIGQSSYYTTLTPGQTFSINATATDNTGTNAPSNTISITIASAPAITFPVDGTSVCNPLTLSGNTLLGTSVEILDNGNPLGNAIVNGTTWTFATAPLGGGSHIFTAVASNPTSPIVEFPITTPNSQPTAIVTGPDGNLWFSSKNEIGRITTSGTITEFPLPAATRTTDITSGPDGNLWFTEFDNNMIGRITTAGSITEFPIPTAGSRPANITVGSDGNLWFTELQGNIGRITTSGTITEFAEPGGPAGIAAGPDGNIWFTLSTSNKIGKITPAGAITEFPIPTANSNPGGIAQGPDGNLWFTERNTNKIGRITPSGVITEFPVLTANSQPLNISAGPDGNLWFTEINANNIGRITTSGVVTEFPTPSAPSAPQGVTTGPDGNIWFTEVNTNNIGKMGTGIQATSVPVTVTVDDQCQQLSVTLTCPKVIKKGQSKTKTVTITNNGSQPVSDITIQELLPQGLCLRSIQGQGWTFVTQGQITVGTFSGTLLPGESTNISICATATGHKNAVKNTVIVTSPGTSPQTVQCCIEIR